MVRRVAYCRVASGVACGGGGAEEEGAGVTCGRTGIEGRIEDIKSLYMSTPATISHVAKRYFPIDGCSHSFGANRRARSGVYLYVALVYGLQHHPSTRQTRNIFTERRNLYTLAESEKLP